MQLKTMNIILLLRKARAKKLIDQKSEKLIISVSDEMRKCAFAMQAVYILASSVTFRVINVSCPSNFLASKH